MRGDTSKCRKSSTFPCPSTCGWERYPGTPQPVIQMIETTFESAKRIGTDKMGFPELFAHSVCIFSEHCGTHIDARSHGGRNDSWSEDIPLDKCYGPGVRLDMRRKKPGRGH